MNIQKILSVFFLVLLNMSVICQIEMFSCPNVSELALNKYNFKNTEFQGDWFLVSDTSLDSVRYNVSMYKHGNNQKYVIGFENIICFSFYRKNLEIKMVINDIPYKIFLDKKFRIEKVVLDLIDWKLKIKCNYDLKGNMDISYKKVVKYVIGSDKDEIEKLIKSVQEYCDKLLIKGDG